MANQRTEPIIPTRLSSGDTIGIVAPAGHFNAEKFLKGVSVLESMGFRTHIPDDVFSQSGYFAGTDQARAEVLMRLFEDDSIQAIMCARGGYGSVKILPFIDVEVIKHHPKVFLGFSDISVLLNFFFERIGLVSFHGSVITSLVNATQLAKDAVVKAISSDKPIVMKLKNFVCIQGGSVSGIVKGGNLTTLCHLTGTPYMPSFNESILVLEDTGEAGYRIDRMLTQMKLAGCFDGIAGIALGSFDNCGRIDELYGIVEEVFEDLGIPILAGFDVGHIENNITFPIGLQASLDADKGVLSFHTSATT